MARKSDATPLIPDGVPIESVDTTGTAMVTPVRSWTAIGTSPGCGQINKLKVVKRQMYGRDNLDLLQARVIAAGR